MPPSKKPSALPHLDEVTERANKASAAIARNESNERKTVALWARPNAAPELRVSCNWRIPPKIRWGSTPSVLKANSFEALSIAVTAIAIDKINLTALR